MVRMHEDWAATLVPQVLLATVKGDVLEALELPAAVKVRLLSESVTLLVFWTVTGSV
jgi:hypothetical protein